MYNSWMGEKPSFTIRRHAPGHVPSFAFNDVQMLRSNAFGPPVSAAEARADEAVRVRSENWWVHGEWPKSDRRPEPRKALYHLLYYKGGLAAVSQTSVRTVHTPRSDLDLLTLAGVFCAPPVRGCGLGKAVILDAFSRLKEQGLSYCLFQAGSSRGLYEKLGATVVNNRFVDRTAKDPEANPWFEDWVMRYPAESPWPGGIIDLNGPGY